MSRFFNSSLEYGFLNNWINPISYIRLASTCLKQGVNPAIVYRILVAIKGVSGEAHDLAGLGYVLKLFSQVQQADLVGNDFVCMMNQEGCLLRF